MQARNRMQVQAIEVLDQSQLVERHVAYAWIDVSIFWATLLGLLPK
jgi:hypothetical protein